MFAQLSNAPEKSCIRRSNRRGAILPLFAILLPVLLILAGFAINVAYMQATATEMQIATDAAARAAGRMYVITGDENEALNFANQAGDLNHVAGQPLTFNTNDLEFGQSLRASEAERYSFQNTNGVATNAVRVLGRRNAGSSDGSVGTILPGIMGRSDFAVSSEAVSTLMEVDIALVFDRSGSMAYADDEPAVYPPIPAAAPEGWDFGDAAPADARWRNAFDATGLFISELTKSPLSEQVSLATYADTGTIDVPLTSSYQSVFSGLGTYTAALEGGGTNIAGGMQAGSAALVGAGSRSFAAKVLIIMTDGHVTVGPNPTTMATQLADEGVMIISVTFSAEADQTLMEQVATIGNGFHLHAEKKEDLEGIFKKIATELPTLLTR